jgi:hypothetical protein
MAQGEGQDETPHFTDTVGDSRSAHVVSLWWASFGFWSDRAGSLGNRWFEEGASATLLLDADLRFFGAMMIGLGIVFFWTIVKMEECESVIYILAGAVVVGAAARIYALMRYGNPGTAGIIPIIIELVLPVFIVLFLYALGKDVRKTERT